MTAILHPPLICTEPTHKNRTIDLLFPRGGPGETPGSRRRNPEIYILPHAKAWTKYKSLFLG